MSEESNWDSSSIAHERLLKNICYGNMDREKSEYEQAIETLRESFDFSTEHEERVRKLLKNDESLIDDLNHLVIAASLLLSDGSQMKDGTLRAYEMGDKIIIEEEGGGEWITQRTLGIQISKVLAHARASARMEEIEGEIKALGEDKRRARELDRLKKGKEGSNTPNISPRDKTYFSAAIENNGKEMIEALREKERINRSIGFYERNSESGDSGD